ncbi:DUF5316 family protein [Alteribacter natronophilus]|uniref:DUF5316 family protein n=1 Tax=Alteribacter natronophilus TaxID=2583810 RepID=UPI00110DD75F|nr:DUF5316 family protein [Alteribacter natronophilus]TMW70870.1 hypothetical protein FGB90_12865 [Alteribacter natronophilus]
MKYSLPAGILTLALLQPVMWLMGNPERGYEISGYMGIGGVIFAGLLFGAFLAASRESAQKGVPDDREGQKKVQRTGIYTLFFSVPHFAYAFTYYLLTV